MYIVFKCPKCGSARYGREGQKTARCFKCNYRMTINIFKIQMLLKTERIEEAIAVVEKHKLKLKKKRSTYMKENRIFTQFKSLDYKKGTSKNNKSQRNLL